MIEVRKAHIGDIKDLFKWRNDNFSRKMMLNTNEIKWKDHLVWHNKTLSDKNIIVLICMDSDKEKVGVVHFKIEPKITKIAINLSPKFRGKGLSKDCIVRSIKYFKSKFPNDLKLCAQIKKTNTISQTLFKNCGFKFIRDMDNIQYLSFDIKKIDIPL